MTEHAEALGQNDAVEAKLQAVVLAAHMQLSEGVLGDARRLENHLIERHVIAALHGLDGLGVDGVDRRAKLRLDRRAGFVEALSDDHDSATFEG